MNGAYSGLVGVALDVRLDRLVAPDDRHARHRKTARQAGPHVGDLLVEVARHVAKTAQIGAIRAGGGEALARREVGPEEGVAVERRFVGPEPARRSRAREWRRGRPARSPSPQARARRTGCCPASPAFASSRPAAPVATRHRPWGSDRSHPPRQADRCSAPSPAAASSTLPCRGRGAWHQRSRYRAASRPRQARARGRRREQEKSARCERRIST